MLSCIKGLPVCEDLLCGLIEENIVVEFFDIESDSNYFQLKPRWRREIHQLGEPQGFTLKELLKMSEKIARKGPETAPQGQPVPHRFHGVNNVKEGNKT